ncbi:MAG: hypothetical protein JW888_08070 [Pirellulales bacterium]|nr:hypothetical protein [Pirellulales bacterium]
MNSETIIAGARTVANLAEYMEELKRSAETMVVTLGGSRRGYFTPSEDEAVRRVLASYWQTRAALFEVVIEFREDTSLDEESRPAAFLVAYAAALLLVDAARFLRDTFQNRPAVRKKLNEPEPHFGIPPRVYDTVQKSLTSTRHAWHLYHARKYYDEHQAELARLGSDPLLAPVLAVIEHLADRIDVPAGRFVTTRMRVQTRRMGSQIRHGLFGRSIYGIMKLFSSLVADVSTRPGHHPSLPAEVAGPLTEMLRPGDVLITRKEYAATNYFLPGYWKHAALYLGRSDDLVALGLRDHEHVRPRWAQLLSPEPQRRVLESMKDGVRIRPLDSPFGADALTVLRPVLDSPQIAEGLARGLFHEGKPYDFDFDFTRSDRLVCTEVVYRSYEGIGPMAFTLTPRAGRLTLSAEDLVGMSLAHAHFEPVAVYSAPHAPGLTTGSAVESVLQQTRPEAG